MKADVGLKGDRIAGIGKAGNPDIQPDVTIIIGPGTEVIAARERSSRPAALTRISTISVRSRWKRR